MSRKDTFGLDKDHVEATVERVRNHLDRNLFAIPVHGANHSKNSGKNPNLPGGYGLLYSVEHFSAECEGGIYHLHSSNLGEFGTVTFPSGKYPRLILTTENPYIGAMTNENGERDERWFASNANHDGWAGFYVNVGLAIHPSYKWFIEIETEEAYYAFLEHVDEMGWDTGVLKGTYVDRSGGGGRHIGFNAPFRSQTFAKALKPFGLEDVELKNSGQIIVPPSKHWKGTRYKVIQDNPYQDAPDWLVDEINRLSASGAASDPSTDDKREYKGVEYDYDPDDPHFKENCRKTEEAIKRHNPGVGSLHSYSLDVSGFLVRRIGEDATRDILEYVWRVMHPAGLRDALKNVRDTARKLDNSKAVTGGGKLLDTHPELLDDLEEIWDWKREEREFFDKFDKKGERTVNEEFELDVPDFPIDSMPEAIRDFIRETAIDKDCNTDLVALPILGTLSAAIGNSVRGVVKKKYKVSASLNLAVVGESGDGKSPALKAAIEPIDEIQKEYRETYEREKAEYERQERRYKGLPPKERDDEDPPEKPTFKRIRVDDTTVEALAVILNQNPRGVYLIQDELSGWLYSLNQYKDKGKGNDKQKYMMISDNTDFAVDRKGAESLYVKDPYVTICGGIQPVRLPVLSNTDEPDGFFQRFLVVYPESRSPRSNDFDVSDDAEDRYFALVRNLSEFGTDDGHRDFRFSDNARDLYNHYCDTLADERDDCGIPSMRASLSKFKEHLAKLATISAVCRIVDTDTSDASDTSVFKSEIFWRVGEEDIEAAWKLITYFKIHMYKVLGNMPTGGTDTYNTTSLDTKVASEIISYLRNKEDCTDRNSAKEWGLLLESIPPHEKPNSISSMLRRIGQNRDDLSVRTGLFKGKARAIEISLEPTEKGVGSVGSVGEEDEDGPKMGDSVPTPPPTPPVGVGSDEKGVGDEEEFAEHLWDADVGEDKVCWYCNSETTIGTLKNDGRPVGRICNRRLHKLYRGDADWMT